MTDLGRPVLLVSLPTEEILQASPAAAELISPDRSEISGQALTELTTGANPESAVLVVNGHLDGFQSRRALRRDPSVQVEFWFRLVAEQDGCCQALVLAASSAEQPVAETPDSADGGDGLTSAVMGSIDRQFQVDRISEEVADFLGRPPSELLGRSLFELLSPDDIPHLLFAVAHSAATNSGVSLAVRLRRTEHRGAGCQLVLFPLDPMPTFAFSLQPASAPGGNRRSSDDWRGVLRRFADGVTSATTAKDLTYYHSGSTATLPELTSREMQIVSRLLAGDRVPAISRQLYLAQSTVRNHLSAVFAKLGVRSQQELIVLLRQAPHRPDR